MFPRLAFVVIAGFAGLSCSDSSRIHGNVGTAERIRADALAAAKQEGKQVLLVFNISKQPDSIWCELLAKYHADPDVARVLGPHLVIGNVDIYETPGGMQLFEEHAPRGAPSFSFLNSDGMLLSDSGEGDQNVGFPNNPEQVDQYLAALTKACPQLTDEDLATLRKKLEALRTPAEE